MTQTSPTPATTAPLTVRYFAAAAEHAGLHEQEVTGPHTLGQLRAWLTAEHGPEFARVLDCSSVLVDGSRPGDDDPLPPGVPIDILPPFAGG